jgi:hypothetical protein
MTPDAIAQPAHGRCPACGAAASGRYCSDCGAALSEERVGARRALRDDAVDMVGFDRRVWATLRDLLLHPVRVTRAYLTEDRRRYLPPLKLFLALGGVYMFALSIVQPYRFDAPSLRRMGVREQDAVRIEQKIRERGIDAELFNERFESRMNTAGPIITALALLPLVPLLRRFDRRRSWSDHLMFILGASNGVWLYSLLLLPLVRISLPLHQAVVMLALYVYLGIVFFAQYPAATRLRTVGRFAVFVGVDLALSLLLSVVLFVAVYLSVLFV